MKGLYTWASDSLQNAYNYTYHAVDSTITFLSPYHLSTTFVNIWTGATQVANLSDISTFILNATPSRQMLGKILLVDGTYVAMNVVYAGYVKQVLRNLPYFENTYLETATDLSANAVMYALWMYLNNRYKEVQPETKKEFLLDAAASINPYRLKLNLYASNIANNTSLATLANRDNEKLLSLTPEQKNKVMYNASCNHPYKECNCHIGSKLQAYVWVTLEYIAEQILILGLEKLIPGIFGKILANILQALSTGRALMGYKLPRMDMRHRREILDQNKAFAFGFGESYLGITKGLTAFIAWRAGVSFDSRHYKEIEYGIGTIVTNLFIVVSIIQGRRYPGTGPSTEFPLFKLSRRLMEETLSLAMEYGIPVYNFFNRLFSNPNANTDWKETTLNVLESKAYKKLSWLVFTRDMQTYQQIFRLPPIKECSDLHVKDFRGMITSVENIREYPLADKIPTVTKKIPKKLLLSPAARYFLCFFFGEPTRKLLDEIKDDIIWVRSIQDDFSTKKTSVTIEELPDDPPLDKVEALNKEVSTAKQSPIVEEVLEQKPLLPIEALEKVKQELIPTSAKRINIMDNYKGTPNENRLFAGKAPALPAPRQKDDSFAPRKVRLM